MSRRDRREEARARATEYAAEQTRRREARRAREDARAAEERRRYEAEREAVRAWEWEQQRLVLDGAHCKHPTDVRGHRYHRWQPKPRREIDPRHLSPMARLLLVTAFLGRG